MSREVKYSNEMYEFAIYTTDYSIPWPREKRLRSSDPARARRFFMDFSSVMHASKACWSPIEDAP